jgi:DNA-binding response OmpR family regulator
MEFELLHDLMLSRGRVLCRVLSRDRLIEKLRGYDADVFDRSIDMLVSRLREKLHDDARNPRFIRTVRRSGYQFVGALE